MNAKTMLSYSLDMFLLNYPYTYAYKTDMVSFALISLTITKMARWILYMYVLYMNRSAITLNCKRGKKGGRVR